jgi:hypothetical protein
MDEGTGVAPLIRKYLLGDLPESEAERIEQMYFAEAERLDEVWAVFGEIAEGYLGGALSEEEARRFERRLRFSPALREMFENEKALFAHAVNGPKAALSPDLPSDPFAKSVASRRKRIAAFLTPAWLAAPAGVVLIALFVWGAFRLSLQSHGNPRQASVANGTITTPTVLPSQTPQAQNPENNDNLAREHSPSVTSPAVASPAVTTPERPKPGPQGRIATGILSTFLLLVDGQRSEQTSPVVEIPAKAKDFQLKLELVDKACAPLTAELRTTSNETLQHWDDLRERQEQSAMRVVAFRVRSDGLESADYMVRLVCAAQPDNPVFVRNYRFTLGRK